MRGGTHPPYQRQGSHHSVLLPITGGGTRSGLRITTSSTTHYSPTPSLRNRRGLTRGLGRYLPERPTYKVSPLREMGGAHDLHLHTTLATRSGYMHRSSHNLGSPSHLPTSAFLDHNGVLGRIHLPILASEVIAHPSPRPREYLGSNTLFRNTPQSNKDLRWKYAPTPPPHWRRL